MSSQLGDLQPLEGVGTEVQLVSLGPNLLEPSANANAGYDDDNDTEQEQEALSHDERMTIVDFIDFFEGVVEKMFDGPLTANMYVGDSGMRIKGQQLADDHMVNRNELRVRGLSAQADISESIYRELGSPECIEKAVECRGQALGLTPECHGERPSQLARLGGALFQRFKGLGDITDINKAIDLLNQGMDIAPEAHPNKLSMRNNIGSAYISRFERLGELSDLENAIECHNQAVQLTPNSHPDKPTGLNNLGSSYLRRYERLGELSDLENGIECQTQGVQLTPDGHPDKPRCLNNLGCSYMRRFGRFGELSDLENAIECQTQAVQITPDGHSDKPTALNNLGNSYRYRFERLGKLSDLGNAIEYLTQTVQLTPHGHPDKPRFLHNLGTSYLFRFERLDELSDLENAIECHTQGVQLTPDGHPDKPTGFINLGLSYDNRFKRFGQLSDLEKAIEWLSQAVQLTPHGHLDQPRGFSNLGTSYKHRFERLGELSDLENAIECQTQAVQLTPDGDSGKPTWLNRLGASYLCRFERLEELSDLGNAIKYLTKAVQLTPDGHPDKPRWLNSLGTSYMRRFERLGEPPTDLDNAIECLTRTVKLTPDDDPEKPMGLNNLGTSYQCRFERLGELSDLENAIEHYFQAVQLTPDGHPDKPGLLNNLGFSYVHRFERLGRLSDLKRAQSTFRHAAQLVLTNPELQLKCARRWARLSSALCLSPKQAYERCMELVPHLIWLGTTINQRYNLMENVHDLASEAASWAISVHSIDLAVEWLEEGRSIVWNQILQLRTPLEELSVVDQSLGSHLKSIASQLEASGSRPATTSTWAEQSPDLEKAAQRHRRLADEWEKGLDRARRIPGFEDFLRPRKASELKLAAKDGPVVLINAHCTCWDALVILPRCDDIAHIPLYRPPLGEPGKLSVQLDFHTVAGRHGEWYRAFKRVNSGTTPEDPLKVELEALWLVVVKPILDALACTRELPIDELPHVTWCATGPLAFASLHAAGIYDGSSLSAFDLVISSYTPSLSALLASGAPVSQLSGGVVAVGQKNTKGLPPLPWTEHELAIIRQHAQKHRFLQLDNKNATVDAVLNAMDEHSWVHLACHATQNPGNPTHSAFHLHDDNLTLEAITKRQFQNKGLAFLSACQTAKGDGKLPDEAVHLAAGMLMAGYPSVIATMWSIADIDGPDVAGRVYAELLKDGKMDHRGSAKALHQAVGELREKIGVNSFKRWVPFIHLGV